MNREQYKSDPRYAKVLETMDLLNITDISTKRQADNGTIVWKLPIKNEWNGKLIEVASFKSGYIRNQNSAHDRSYQLNKRIDSEPEYFETDKKDWCGRPLYRQFTTRTCKLIPDEQDRLAYLISFCLKNYYINHANKVARSSDEYIPKWKYEDEIKRTKELHVWQEEPEVKVIVNGHRYNVI